ncbi:MAG: bifunctional phosphoribosyl-AMP cyclohydrolase/phosphoribosyl-ATP diphosphatase HisIE [Eubacterium sp.]|nr:bifunctional phosphoribosyl-AMP cyclohydrolase/phosphoribosyl-ATP diphosphatase HisIE [Eubacterium sp.]
MAFRKLIPFINAESEFANKVILRAEKYCYEGADELFIYNYSKMESDREEFIATLKKVEAHIDIPFMVGLYVNRFEDVKKAFYTGASRVVIKYDIMPSKSVLDESVARFGADRILVEIDSDEAFEQIAFPVDTLLIKHVDMGGSIQKRIMASGKNIVIRDSLLRNDLVELMELPQVSAVSTNYFEDKSLFKVKKNLKNAGVDVNIFDTSVPFSEFKTDEKGLVPCVTQDYRTGEVLMMAYMNQESYERTLETGRMTYFSRSRNELWCKGDTSGHYQYVKELRIDCDRDTILARVHQIGAACHTGEYSCFFTELARRDYIDTNPLTILKEDFDLIQERKENPKEGSYTNYLFTKGLDKILKKCGEEASEIIIAAKNPENDELVYEMADFLYHMMVLMADRGLTWADITRELANRRR